MVIYNIVGNQQVTNAPFAIDLTFTVRAVGTSGSFWAFVDNWYPDLPERLTGDGPSLFSVDTTQAQNVTFTVQWSAASTSDIFVLNQAYLEMLN
jgi:hypothetical protein